MLPSQRLRITPLTPWIIAEKNGKVICEHCTCMVGIEELCTHIAMILSWTEKKVKFNSSQPVTDKDYYWLAPKDDGKTVLQPKYKIDFTSTKIKKG